MTSVKIADLKNRLSEYLRAVEQGEQVVVTDRKRPIARIVPIEHEPASLSVERPRVPFSTVRKKRHPRAGWSTRSLDLLAVERGER